MTFCKYCSRLLHLPCITCLLKLWKMLQRIFRVHIQVLCHVLVFYSSFFILKFSLLYFINLPLALSCLLLFLLTLLYALILLLFNVSFPFLFSSTVSLFLFSNSSPDFVWSRTALSPLIFSPELECSTTRRLFSLKVNLRIFKIVIRIVHDENLVIDAYRPWFAIRYTCR